MKTAKVAVIKTSPDSVLCDVAEAMKLAEFERFLAKGNPTILKDNISWHLPMPGSNTTPWQLEGVIRALKEAGYVDLVAVENRTVVTRPRRGEVLNKYDIVYQAYDIPVKYNFKAQDMKWVRFQPRAELHALPRVFGDNLHIPDFFFEKNIVHLPTLKCHIYTTTTGAMKNAFGGLLDHKRHYTHTWIHQTLVDLLKIQMEIHSGIFAVMDGTTAGNGPGPRTLKPVEADYILASGDQVAIDAVGAWMMGFDPMDIPYIRLATEEGLGEGDISRIEIVGSDLPIPRFRFRVGDNLASVVGDYLWYGPLRRIQGIFFRTPLVYLFVAASDWYHDQLWWRLKGQRVYGRWLRESKWGRLFSEYKCSSGDLRKSPVSLVNRIDSVSSIGKSGDDP